MDYFPGCPDCEYKIDKFPLTDSARTDWLKEPYEFLDYLRSISHKNMAVIDHIYLGENAEVIGEHMSTWLTKHLENKTTPLEIHQMWEKYIQEGEPTKDVPGKTKDNLEGRIVLWEEGVEELPELEIDKLYMRAYYGGAHTIRTLHTSTGTELVAVRGAISKEQIPSYLEA